MVKITDDDFDDTSAIVCTGSTAELQSREIKNLVHGAAIPSPPSLPQDLISPVTVCYQYYPQLYCTFH